MPKSKTTQRSTRKNTNTVELIDKIEETTEAYENANDTEKEELAQLLEQLLIQHSKYKHEIFDLRKIDATKERAIQEAVRIIRQQSKKIELLEKNKKEELKDNKELLRVFDDANKEIDKDHIKKTNQKCNLMYENYMNMFETAEQKKTSKKK